MLDDSTDGGHTIELLFRRMCSQRFDRSYPHDTAPKAMFTLRAVSRSVTFCILIGFPKIDTPHSNWLISFVLAGPRIRLTFLCEFDETTARVLKD